MLETVIIIVVVGTQSKRVLTPQETPVGRSCFDFVDTNIYHIRRRPIMKLKPLADRVIVKLVEAEETTMALALYAPP